MNKPFEFMLDYFNRKLDISNSQLIRSEEVKKKAKQTCFERYGVEHALQSQGRWFYY